MDDENNNPSSPNAQNLALRIQKKLASKVSSKNMAKIFIDDVTGRCLDNLSRLIREHSGGSKKQAEAILNDIIKIILKIGVLFKNDQLNRDEMRACDRFRQTFHSFAKSALSFYEIEFTYDQKYLRDLLSTCQDSIHEIIRAHLTDKSKGRVDNVFGYFNDAQFLDDVFKNRKYHKIMQAIVDDVRKLLDDGLV
jgi:hypothetical protein